MVSVFFSLPRYKTPCLGFFFHVQPPKQTHVDLFYGLGFLLREDCALLLSFSESTLQRTGTVFFSCCIVVVVVAAAAEPSNLMLCYRTLFPCGSDGDTDVDYCFWEVSLASPMRTCFFFSLPPHKQIILNHWKMGVRHTAALLQIMHCYKGCNCPLSAGLTWRMKPRRPKEMDRNDIIMQKRAESVNFLYT